MNMQVEQKYLKSKQNAKIPRRNIFYFVDHIKTAVRKWGLYWISYIGFISLEDTEQKQGYNIFQQFQSVIFRFGSRSKYFS